MEKIFFTPGPSQLYPTVAAHYATALAENLGSISHRSKKFQEIFAETTANLRKLLNIPSDYHIYFMGSANEAWERILQNTIEKSSVHFINGSFSNKFYDFANQLGLSPGYCQVGEGFGFENAADHFATIQPATELIAFCANETATGVATLPEFIYDFRTEFPEKLIAVDLVSAWPFYALEVHKVDMAYFSVQKGFGMPAGLGILAVSPRAQEISERLNNPGTYHTFSALREQEEKNMTPETPNVLGIYLLGKVAGDMLTIGIENLRKETIEKANMLREAISASQSLSVAVDNPSLRSQTVVVADCADPKSVMEKLAAEGCIIGDGYGKAKNTQIRIANFPAHSLEAVNKLAQLLRQL